MSERLTPEQQQIVADNLGLCGWAVQRWGRHLPDGGGQGYTREDAYQDAVFGLIRAVQKYDPTTGNTLATYASAWLRTSIQRGEDAYGGVDARAYRDGPPVKPASLDAPVGDDKSPLVDLVSAADADGLDDLREWGEAVMQVREVRSLRSLVCRDRLDEVVFDAFTDPAQIGRGCGAAAGVVERTGVSRATVQNRRIAVYRRITEQCDRLSRERAS